MAFASHTGIMRQKKMDRAKKALMWGAGSSLIVFVLIGN